LAHDEPPETNRWARAQIEVVGFSQESPYQFDEATLARLAALLGLLERIASIPLTRPFPDAMPPTPWAVKTFSRRHSGDWGTVAGWFGHVEVPGGNDHWDPGALRWSELLARARGTPGATADRWTTTGGRFTRDPVVGQNRDGRLEAVVTGEDGHLHGLAQTAPGGDWWAKWADLGPPPGGAAGNPAGARAKPGRLAGL